MSAGLRVYLNLVYVQCIIKRILRFAFCRPLDFFCGQKNRISIAIAFGATAGNCLSILWEIEIYDKLPGPTWVKGTKTLIGHNSDT